MIIKNGKIFGENAQFAEGTLYIENRKIVNKAKGQIIDASGLYVIPGLTDIHFHGCAGYDFCDGTKESLKKITEYELKNGITTICPASMTLSEKQLISIFENAADYENKNGSTLVGINMEGPFISLDKKGAQNQIYIHRPDVEMFYRLQRAAKGLIKLVDIAPESDGALDFIERLKESVHISLAHTGADFDIAQEAFERGADHVTHLYNAMAPYSHRAPGVIGAACEQENVMVEIICDGVHIHPATVRTTFKMFGEDRIIFISDSMMACGLDDGQYTLGGQNVTVKEKTAFLTGEGNIAGSVTNLMDCIRIAVNEMKIPLEKAVRCATVNPAKSIGIYDKYGSLTPGKTADVVLLDENLEIQQIIKDGNIVDM